MIKIKNKAGETVSIATDIDNTIRIGITTEDKEMFISVSTIQAMRVCKVITEQVNKINDRKYGKENSK